VKAKVAVDQPMCLAQIRKLAMEVTDLAEYMPTSPPEEPAPALTELEPDLGELQERFAKLAPSIVVDPFGPENAVIEPDSSKDSKYIDSDHPYVLQRCLGVTDGI